MDNISYTDMESMMRRIVREEMSSGCVSQCPLLEANVSHEEHKQHHLIVRKVTRDGVYIRRAFVAGILVAITGGILGLIWAFAQQKVGFLPLNPAKGG